jgi:hypothetical protein
LSPRDSKKKESRKKQVIKNGVDTRASDPHESKILKDGSHYAFAPIPAFQVLAGAKEHGAQQVLLALILHQGKNSNSVWPSYKQIQYIVGIGPDKVKSGLAVLLDLGFIKKAQWREGKTLRSRYYLQDCCYNSGLMSDKAKAFRKKGYRCFACLKYVDRGEFGFGPTDKKVHFGCGGYVYGLKARKGGLVEEEG